jgi:hypothetical protein
MSKSSTSVNRKALKLDKVKAINHCDVGENCRTVGEEMAVGRTKIMNILKREREILDDFENNASTKFQFNVVLLAILLLYIKYRYLFIYYHIEIISSTINVNKSNITTGTT